jgi:hypothetical protein
VAQRVLARYFEKQLPVQGPLPPWADEAAAKVTAEAPGESNGDGLVRD